MSSLHKLKIEVSPTVDILRKVDLFSCLAETPEALEILSEQLRYEILQPGTKVIEEGKVGENLYILVKGSVSIFKTTPDSDMYKVAIVPAGNLATLGEGSLVSNETRSATVICDTECDFLILSRNKFLKFSEEHPSWAVPLYRKIAGILATRVKKLNTDVLLLHEALTKEIREG